MNQIIKKNFPWAVSKGSVKVGPWYYGYQQNFTY